MAEKIIISFDDEEANEKVDISFPEKAEKPKELKPVTSYYRGNTGLSGLYQSDFQASDGLTTGISEVFGFETKKQCFTGLLATSKEAVILSNKGIAYFIDKSTGKMNNAVSTGGAIEKTGVVVNDVLYCCTLDSVYKIRDGQMESVYKSFGNEVIWSNLNYYNGVIYFITNDNFAASVYGISLTGDIQYKTSVTYKNNLCQQLCCDRNIFFCFDNKVCVINPETNTMENYEHTSQITNVYCSINGRFHFLDNDGKVLFFEKGKIIYSGVSGRLFNSMVLNGQYLFTAGYEGWKAYTSSMHLSFEHPENEDTIIQAVTGSCAAATIGNKIMFHNIRKMQSAESFIIRSENKCSIISAAFYDDKAFVLTDNGILTAYQNKKLNIDLTA